MKFKKIAPTVARDEQGKLWMASEIQPSVFAQRIKCDLCGKRMEEGMGERHWHSGQLWACAEHAEDEP